MPLSIDYDEERRLVDMRATGVLALPDFLQAMEAVRHPPAGQAVEAILFDQSEVSDVSISSGDVKDVALLTRSLEEAQGVRMAIVAPEDVVFGVSRMYELVRDDGGNVRTFRDRETALRWLLDPDGSE